MSAKPKTTATKSRSKSIATTLATTAVDPVAVAPTTIETTKIHLNGMFYLVDSKTNMIYTYDPEGIVHVWVGHLTKDGALVYRDGWKDAIAHAHASIGIATVTPKSIE